MPKISKTKVLIVEDSPSSREHLRHLLSVYEDLHVLAAVDNTHDAWELINASKIQGVFLDINILGESDRAGMDLAARLQTLPIESQPWLIFISGYNQYALEAHRYHTLHYLVKPLDKNKLHEALLKIRAVQQNMLAPERIAIHVKTDSGHGVQYRQADEIIYLQTFHNGSGNVKIKLRDGFELIAKETLQKWLVHDALHFLKIHNSCLVNKQHLTGYLIKDGKYHATFQHCTDELPIGERFLTDFLALFSLNKPD